jgi:hypothetical protein
MVSRYLTDEGFAHVKYQGSMSRDERGRAVRAFMAKDNATVMLMSLKCGGVGLNLTRANRVLAAELHAVPHLTGFSDRRNFIGYGVVPCRRRPGV